MVEVIALMGMLITLLLSVIAYFLKQAHGNMLALEHTVKELKSSLLWIKARMQGHHELLRQRIDLLEKRVDEGK